MTANNPLHRYTPTQDELDRVDRDHTYHQPNPATCQAQRYEHIRAVAKEYAKELLLLCPPSRERSLALTHLDDVVFWANASIARNEQGKEVAATR
jgi:hypothetical protein